MTPSPGPGAHPGMKRPKVSNSKQFLIITMQSLAETALRSISRSFSQFLLYSFSLTVVMLHFNLGHLLSLPQFFMCLQDKFLYLPVNPVLHIPEKLIHFSTTTLTWSTDSALLLEASYPNLYSTPLPTLLCATPSSPENITLSEYILSCSKNWFCILIRICQHILWGFTAYQFAPPSWLGTPDQLL